MQQTHWFSHWGCKHIFLTTEAANTDFQTRGCKQILNHWGCIHRCLSKPEAENVHLQWLLRQKSLKNYFKWEFFSTTAAASTDFQPRGCRHRFSTTEAENRFSNTAMKNTDFQLLRLQTEFVFSPTLKLQTEIFNNWGCKHSHSDYVGNCDGWRQFSRHISISFAMSEPWA